MLGLDVVVDNAPEVSVRPRWSVGDRVIWVVLINEPRHCIAGEKMLATVRDCFPNGRRGFTYRLTLDKRWEEGYEHGKPIIVGNITEWALRPIGNI